MPKLPPVSGRDIVLALQRLGFAEAAQRGSHVKLRRGGYTCIVPLHREVKRGILAGRLRQAKLTPEQFLRAMTQ